MKRLIFNKVGLYFLSLFTISSIVASFLYLYTVNNYNIKMNEHITSYDDKINGKYETDKQYLCVSIGCTGILSMENNKILKVNDNGILTDVYNSNNDNYKIYHIIDSLYVLNYKIALYNKLSNTYYMVSWEKFLELLAVIFATDLISIIIISIPVYKMEKREHEYKLLKQASAQRDLLTRNTIKLTDNIGHEIKSPLDSIVNHTEMIKRVVTRNYGNIRKPITDEEREKLRIRLEEEKTVLGWFDFIAIAEKQIYGKLETISTYKHIKSGNRKRNLRQLISAALSIISSESSVEGEVDSYLRKFYVKNIPESDVVGIFINHIKNSIEPGADAQKVKIIFVSYENEVITLYLIDDGNGIPNDFVDKVFEENTSTKKSDTVVRGNGMYLSKLLLKKYGGGIRVAKTSNKGTILEIKIPGIKESNEKNNGCDNCKHTSCNKSFCQRP